MGRGSCGPWMGAVVTAQVSVSALACVLQAARWSYAETPSAAGQWSRFIAAVGILIEE